MTVISTTPDTEALTLTVVTELAAPPARVWQLWVDPRQLEQWWGPPTWPSTFEQHDFWAGGSSRYFMTGPEGQKARGWWTFVAADEPRSLEFEDGFSDESGTPSQDMPTMRITVDIAELPTGSRMTVTTYFASAGDMEQLVTMGMAEGMTGAMGQMDAILAASQSVG